MRARGHRSRRCGGWTAVETALVLPLCLLVLFGLVEAARLIAARGLLDNAVGQAARLAAVSTNTRSTQDIQTYVAQQYSGKNAIPGLTIQVYLADPTTGSNLGAWTNAGRGQYIAVEAVVTHTVVLPTFGLLQNPITLKAKSITCSQGN